MIRTSLALIVLLAALPAAAQDAAPAPETPPSTEKPDLREGFDLMEEGGKLILRHLFEEMEPALRDIEGALKEAEPMLRDLMTLMGEVDNYNAPEMLPNGDIIIRRKTPLENTPEGETEL